MRLKYQLFLTLLLAGALLTALMAGLGRWSFDRGFLDYVNEIERARLEPLAEALAEEYARHADWDWITADGARAWRQLVSEHTGRRRRGGSRGEGPPPPPKGDEPAPPSRLVLVDAEFRPLVGRVPAGRTVLWQPIEFDGTRVGNLGRPEMRAPTEGLDEAFAERQRRGFGYAALAMVLLSALLAIPLAARLVRPLLGVADAVERIGRGEYAHRMPATRRDEIGDLARDVNRLAGTLESSLAARRRWLAEISHELRTPVAILRGELEAIQDGVQALDAAAVDSLHAETLRLSRLIDDLHALTLSDAGALDYRFESLDLREVTAARLQAGQVTAGAAVDVELAPGESPLRVRGDRQRLGQLVDNLLQNSLRYTDAGGTVRVTLARDADDIVMEWSDSAPGVDAEHLPRLFEPMYRVDASRHRQTGGAGLGLAIVAKIVEAHGGTVSAHPSSLGGLALRVRLPTSDGDRT